MAEHLGPYRLEQRLAAGGMAEVFLARGKDPNGVPRWCVIKRMLPHIAADPHFAAMFLDEAKLVAQLHHPGIAALYDFGRADDQLYLAMEYVPGATLRAVVKDHTRRSARLPFAVAAELIAQAALALDYAHQAKDLAGRPLNLVHRDVSPQNILLGTTGEVKLIDFGVAKAASASQVTAQGIIKGKFPYMSPEQIRGQPLDPRSDLFGLGLVLYELIAGHRAIGGATDVEISQNALAMKWDPVERSRPDVPGALRDILDRALQKDRKKRHASAGELARELRRWLERQGPVPPSSALAAILPAAVQPAAAPSSQPFWEGASPGPSPVDASQKPTALVEGDELARLMRPPSGEAALEPTRSAVVTPGSLPQPPLAELPAAGEASGSRLRRLVRARTLPWILSTAVLAVGFVVLVLAVRAQGQRETPRAVSVAAPVPAPPAPPSPAPSTPTAPPPGPAPTAPAASAVLTLSASPPAQIVLDGQPRGRTPLELAVAPGDHLLVFEDPKTGKRQSRKLSLAAGEARAEAWRRGTVTVRAVPWGEVTVDGEAVGVTPLAPLELSAGKHRVRVANPDTQREATREVDVAAGANAVLKFDLR